MRGLSPEEVLAICNTYTDDSLEGVGAIAGKPCQIQSVADITGGHRITFLWVDNSDVEHTSTLDVMNGKGISTVSVDANNHLIITYSDGTTTDAGAIEITAAVNSINTKKGDVVLTADDLNAYTKTETDSKITTEIEKLDVTDTAVEGSYLTAVSEADGKISVTRETSDATPTENSKKMAQSGGIYTALATKQDTLTFDDAPTSASTNPVKSGGVYSGIVANTQLISDTVGWNGKNLLDNDLTNTFPVVEKNGVTFSVQKDNSIIVNGTATANITDYFIKTHLSLKAGKYICTGNPEGTTGFVTGLRISDLSYATVNYFFEGGFELTLNSDIDELRVDIRIGSGATFNNAIFKPMIRLADILDDTYEPYRGTTAFPRDEQAVLGSKNLLPQVEHANTTVTINDVTITSQEDGSVLLNGTSTDAVSYHFIRLSSDANRKFIKQVAGKKVILSGTNVSNTDVRVQFWSTTTNVIADTTGKGTTFTIPSDLATTGDYNFAIWIPSGTTINNVIAYPMLRFASDPDDTYVPYAMTNRELTGEVNKNIITLPHNAATYDIPLKRVSNNNYTFGLVIIAGGVYHFWLKSSSESDAVVIQKIIDSNSSRTLTGSYADGILTLTFNSTVYGGIMVETNNVVKS